MAAEDHLAHSMYSYKDDKRQFRRHLGLSALLLPRAIFILRKMLDLVLVNFTTAEETVTDSLTMDTQIVAEDRVAYTDVSYHSSFWTTDSVELETREAIVAEKALWPILTDIMTNQTVEAVVTEQIHVPIVTDQALEAIVTNQTLEAMVTEQISVPIVTGSLTEQVITVSLLLTFWLYVNLTNGFLLCVMRKMRVLDTPQYMILASYMVGDVLYCNTQLPVMVPIAIESRMDAISEMTCRVFITACTGFILACFHLVCLIAYERYSYFITPLKYPRKFTKVRIYLIVATIYTVSFCISLVVDLISPRIPVATTMSCQATGPYIKITNILYFIFFFIPSGLVSVVTLIRLRLMMSKHKAQVAALPQAIGGDQSAVNGIIVKPIRQAVKMVSLVSGSFWLTTMPGAIIRLSLSASGVTWLDTDYRVSLSLFALSRASYLLITLVSSVLNPIIYITVLPGIREAAWKILRLNK